jgi:hypothetical protein
MIVPTALDLSYRNDDKHFQTFGTDYEQLIATLNSGLCLIKYAGDDFTSSSLFKQLETLPQAYRKRCQDIIARLPKSSMPEWNGEIDSPSELAGFDMHVVAVSRAKFYGLFQYPSDENSITLTDGPNTELTVWNALQLTDQFKRAMALWHGEIIPESRLHELWKERFHPLLTVAKWSRIILIDRYFFSGKTGCNFDNLDFLIKHLESDTQHNASSSDGKDRRFAVHIAVEKEMICGYDKRNDMSFNYTSEILAHAKALIDTTSNIRELVIYAFSRRTMQTNFHDRYLFLRTPANNPLLYAYEIGVGFSVLGDDRIDSASSFHFKMYPLASECTRFNRFDELRLKVYDPKTGPSQNHAKVRILFDS